MSSTAKNKHKLKMVKKLFIL